MVLILQSGEKPGRKTWIHLTEQQTLLEAQERCSKAWSAKIVEQKCVMHVLPATKSRPLTFPANRPFLSQL